MQNRIEELAAQCWDTRKYSPPWFDYEKFAKLIANECAGIAYRTGDDGDCYANSILYEFDVDGARDQK